MTIPIDRVELRRLSSGSAPLDAILGGGLPERSLSVIAGAPGVGKTVFALQLLFHLARQNKRTVFFTTLSEPSMKLIRYMQQFAFFDVGLLNESVSIVDLGSALLEEGPERALEVMKQHVEQHECDFVVIDSFKAVHDVLDAERPLSRRVVYELAVWLAAWGATTILVGEYEQGDIARLPEFAIADGIIRLTHDRRELTSFRQIEILKMRGADYVTGLHFFAMGPDGLTFFPRVRAPDRPDDGAVMAARERVTTGLAELDAMFGGGPLRSSTTLVEGGTGTGKTLLGLRFLLAGIERGEAAVHLGLEETPDQLRGLAATLGWDLVRAEASGHLRLSYRSPVELSTDLYLDQARRQVAELGARRVVLDGLSSLALGVPSERRLKELVYASAKHFRAADATVYMTLELEEALGSGQLGGRTISSLADNVILLRHLEVEDRLEGAILLLKARGTAHDRRVRQFSIDAGGPHVGGLFAEVRGAHRAPPPG